MRNTARFAALAAVLTLSACTTLVPTGGATPQRGVDTIRDDLTTAVLAFDTPAAVQPVAERSRLAITLTVPGSAPQTINAGLVLADADLDEGALPPPAKDRAYFLLQLAEKDRAALKAAQQSAATAPAGVAMVTVSLAPSFCQVGPLGSGRYTVRVILPGQVGPLTPLVADQPVSPTGQPLPSC